MSVFTKVSHRQLKAFLAQYPLAQLIGFQGIGEGVENTNYFVDTADGRWVLTLFERLNYDDLPYFLGLMDHLARRGIPCPMPVAMNNGKTLSELNGKPAAIINRLSGGSVLFPNVAQCRAAGELLAQMHVAGRSFPMQLDNSRGATWRSETATLLIPQVDQDTAALLDDELNAQRTLDLTELPQGVIHADLFRDNVLFVGDRIGGAIDFYYACNDALLYDLAVTVNDWCFEIDGTPNAARAHAMIEAYRALRELTPAESRAWPLVLRAAALRFWLSRLYDWHFPREGDLVHVKDPAQYRRVLEYYRQHGPLPLG